MDSYNKIHVRYIVAILLAIIVLLVTVKWTKVTDLKDYVSFALTLSSLLLAVIAIFHNMISSSNFSDIVASLNSSSGQLKTSAQRIDESSERVLKEIKKIPSSIDDIKTEVSSTKSLIHEMEMKKTPKKHDHKSESRPLDDKSIESFLKQNSILGLQTLYCLYCSKITGQRFSWQDLAKEIEDLKNSERYMYGYSVAIEGIGITERDINADAEIKVLTIHPYIEKHIKKSVYKETENGARKFFNRNKPLSSENSEAEEVEEWTSTLRKIEYFFDVNKKEEIED